MKRIINILILFFLAIAVVSCGDSGKGTKFNPKERTSSLSDDERADAIAKKRNQYAKGMLDTMLYGHGVKLCIIEPKVKGDITQEASHNIAIKMLEMATQNGISGMGNNPTFVLGAEIAQTEKEATGTAPQKMIVKYALTYKVMNTITGDVYATTKQEITGVGRSFEEATTRAVRQVENTTQIQQMLSTASDRIISWYNDNLGELKRMVDGAVGNGNFSLALALVESVPEQAKVAAEYASQRQPELFNEWKHKIASENLSALQAAIASAGEEFDPSIGAYFNLIPSDSPEYAQAQSLYSKYQEELKQRRAELEEKAEREKNAEAQRAWEQEQERMKHETELAQIEVDKIKAQYEAKATARVITSNSDVDNDADADADDDADNDADNDTYIVNNDKESDIIGDKIDAFAENLIGGLGDKVLNSLDLVNELTDAVELVGLFI